MTWGVSVRRVLASSVLWAVLGGPSTARAGDAVSLEVVQKGQEGHSHPALLLVPNMAAAALDVELTCGSERLSRHGPAPAGERIRMEIEVPEGTWTCSGSLAARFEDGSAGEMPLSFQVTQLPPLEVEVAREHLDIENNTLQIRIDRPGRQVEVEVLGAGGKRLGGGTTPIEGVAPGEAATVEWAAEEGEVFRIHLRVVDADGFWTGVDLFPWSYDIPHEDVNFETGRWEIRPSEEQKLEDAYARANEVLGKYTFVDVPMKLFVGGYTDSVGSRESNQILSTRRARAIARWFIERGFEHPVYYQGFGEDALAVPTPDEKDEVRNRRAVYVLAAETPPTEGDFPRANWKQAQ